MTDFSELAVDRDGLVPAVVQDADDGTVLMVAWMNSDAFAMTKATGVAHFWSRKRKTLWKKGETSGNELTVTDIAQDCDADTLLVSVHPSGPTCHTGGESCFGERRTSLGVVVDELAATIASREGADAAESYTATVLSTPDLAERKLIEEAAELAFASKDARQGGDHARVVEESADVLYHLLVLLRGAGVSANELAAELIARRG